MKKWNVTIKEFGNPHPISTCYYGDVNYLFVRDFFGCQEPDVEWYEIKEE